MSTTIGHRFCVRVGGYFAAWFFASARLYAAISRAFCGAESVYVHWIWIAGHVKAKSANDAQGPEEDEALLGNSMNVAISRFHFLSPVVFV